MHMRICMGGYAEARSGGKDGLCQLKRRERTAGECAGDYMAQGKNTAWGVLRYGRMQGCSEYFKS
jgi:hypothetical protein